METKAKKKLEFFHLPVVCRHKEIIKTIIFAEAGGV